MAFDKLDLSVLSDNEVLAFNGMADVVADESCQGHTLRAMTNAFVDRVRSEMQKRGLKSVCWFDLPQHFKSAK